METLRIETHLNLNFHRFSKAGWKPSRLDCPLQAIVNLIGSQWWDKRRSLQQFLQPQIQLKYKGNNVLLHYFRKLKETIYQLSNRL